MNMKKMGIILGTTLIALQAGTAQAWTWFGWVSYVNPWSNYWSADARAERYFDALKKSVEVQNFKKRYPFLKKRANILESRLNKNAKNLASINQEINKQIKIVAQLELKKELELKIKDIKKEESNNTTKLLTQSREKLNNLYEKRINVSNSVFSTRKRRVEVSLEKVSKNRIQSEQSKIKNNKNYKWLKKYAKRKLQARLSTLFDWKTGAIAVRFNEFSKKYGLDKESKTEI